MRYETWKLKPQGMENKVMGLIELDNEYKTLLAEYNSSPSGSKIEFELGKKLDELDKKIAKEAIDVEYDWEID
mgnify:FL=1